MTTQYTIEWKRGRGRNTDRIVMHFPRLVNEVEAIAMARGLAGVVKGVELWKEEDVTTVEKLEFEEDKQ